MGVRNPFQLHNIMLNLNLYQLDILLRTLASSNPSGTEEGAIIQLHSELSEIKKRIEQNDNVSQ